MAVNDSAVRTGVSLAAENAQYKTPHKSASYKHRPFLRQFYNDGKYLASQPDFYLIVGALGAAPFVFPATFNNESLSLNKSLDESSNAHAIFKYGAWIGQASLQVGVAVMNIGVGSLTHSSSLQSFGSDIIRAQGYNAIVTLSMKAAINRPRPNGAPYSYPSGHTSTSFASAGVVYSHFGKAWGAVAFVGASYVGLSRIVENKHYLSDVLSGAIIGSYIGLRIGHRSSVMRRLSIAPATGFERGGLALALHF